MAHPSASSTPCRSSTPRAAAWTRPAREHCCSKASSWACGTTHASRILSAMRPDPRCGASCERARPHQLRAQRPRPVSGSQRSSDMTARYEAARGAAARLIGGQPNELVFTRGATEAINLVARTLPRNGRNRVLVSQLEHHSNIVPWQLAGFEVDAVPLTPDGQIDLDAAEEMQ